MNKKQAAKLEVNDMVRIPFWHKVGIVNEIIPAPTAECRKGAFPQFLIEDDKGNREVYTYRLLMPMDGPVPPVLKDAVKQLTSTEQPY